MVALIGKYEDYVNTSFEYVGDEYAAYLEYAGLTENRIEFLARIIRTR